MSLHTLEIVSELSRHRSFMGVVCLAPASMHLQRLVIFVSRSLVCVYVYVASLK